MNKLDSHVLIHYDDDPLVRVALPASIDNLNTVLKKLNTQRPSVHDSIHPVKHFAVSEKIFLQSLLIHLNLSLSFSKASSSLLFSPLRILSNSSFLNKKNFPVEPHMVSAMHRT